MRLAVTVLATAVVVIVAVNGARAERVNGPGAAAAKTPRADKTARDVAPLRRKLPDARVESVLMDPRGAVAGTKQGIGWLLHYGTERDTCARADATSGLRVMCVIW